MTHEVRLCNCARCGKELLGASMAEWRAGLLADQRAAVPEPVSARLDGRPYCAECLDNCPPRIRRKAVSQVAAARGEPPGRWSRMPGERTKKLPFGIVATEMSMDVWEWQGHSCRWRWRRVVGEQANFGPVGARGEWQARWHLGTIQEAACFGEGHGIGAGGG